MARKRREVWTLDAETDPFHACEDTECLKCAGVGRISEPFIWGAYDGDRFEEFENAAKVVEFFEGRGALVYAHNGGKFDYHYLREYVNSDEPLMVINGRLSRFKIGTSEFRDSLNIFPNTRLQDFGGKIEIDYDLMEPGKRGDPNIRAEIVRYLRQDCILLWDMVNRYRKEYGRSLTQATASLKYWEKMYEIKAPRQTLTQHRRYKPYYYGGRVQCFESGSQACRFGVADINSAYPEAMLREHIFSPEAVEERHLPAEPEIYRCLISLDCTSRGAFPWRDPETRELYFPDDEGGNRNRMRTYHITGWEFIKALEHDAISNIHIRNVHVFTQTMNFKKYIEFFFEMREEARRRGDVAGRIFGKYFMNSLYGKFGADCSKYAEYTIATMDSLAGYLARGYKEWKPWGDRYLLCREPTEEDLENPESRWRFYNVPTAASITGYVRAKLFDSLMKVSGPLYCDTDSIKARDTSKLEFGTELGKWKDEGRFDYTIQAGKKMYADHREGMDWAYDPKAPEKDKTWKIASKGVNFASLAQGPELMEKIANGEEIAYTNQVPTYSIIRQEPKFIPRKIKNTYKNISLAPEVNLE